MLRVLDVSSNPLGSYLDQLERSRSGATGLQQALMVLRLRDVGLSRWPGRLLRGLRSLTTLDMGENRLTTIPDGSLAPLVRLRHVDLSLNWLVAIDPSRLTMPSARPPPSLDLTGNPLDCTCSLSPLCRHVFPVVDDSEPSSSSSMRNVTAVSPALYRCRTPAEWNGVALAEFCADVRTQCSTLPRAVLAAAVGGVAAVVAVLVTAVVCRRRYVERRRRRGVPVSPASSSSSKAAAAAAARCRSSDDYQFVDETSLTSSSNGSSAATTTSAVPVPPVHLPSAPSRHSAAVKTLPPSNASAHRGTHQELLLTTGSRHWL